MKVFAGNWKMNKTSAEALIYFKKLSKLIKDSKELIILAVPFTALPALAKAAKKTNIKLAAQDVFYENKGAYTGEISPAMIKEFADYVIIGHSERRNYFNEDDEILNKKTKAALMNKLKVIFCVGEKLEQREKGLAKSTVKKQILAGLKEANLSNIILAYEPVWAIGTGKTATPVQAEEMHLFIKELTKKEYKKNMKVIYGGSVNSKNAKDILKMKHIDGCLPGGASLDAKEFSKIINSS